MSRLSLSKILKKFLEPIQSYEDVPFSRPKWPICCKQIFLVKITNITFVYLLTPFTLQNLKKSSDRELWGCTIFVHKMVHLPQTRFFLEKTLILFSSTCWSLSMCKIFLKKFNANPELWGCTIFGSKMAHLPKQEFFVQPSKLGKIAGGKKLLLYMYYFTAVRQQKFQHVCFVVSIIKSHKQMLKCFLQMIFINVTH